MLLSLCSRTEKRGGRRGRGGEEGEEEEEDEEESRESIICQKYQGSISCSVSLTTTYM